MLAESLDRAVPLGGCRDEERRPLRGGRRQPWPRGRQAGWSHRTSGGEPRGLCLLAPHSPTRWAERSCPPDLDAAGERCRPVRGGRGEEGGGRGGRAEGEKEGRRERREERRAAEPLKSRDKLRRRHSTPLFPRDPCQSVQSRTCGGGRRRSRGRRRRSRGRRRKRSRGRRSSRGRRMSRGRRRSRGRRSSRGRRRSRGRRSSRGRRRSRGRRSS
eukprot:764653-Hanusia_phi.AAC.8